MNAPAGDNYYFPGFCKDAFWDLNITWYTDRPDFTDCFHQTALIWLPCGLLWLLLPLQIYNTVARNSHRTKAWTWLSVARMVIAYKVRMTPSDLAQRFVLIFSAILALISFTELSYVLNLWNTNSAEVFPVQLVAPAMLCAAMLLAGLYIYLDKTRTQTRSGILFCFWLLLTLCGLLTFISKLMDVPIADDFVDAVRLLGFPFVLVQFILSCFGEKFTELVATGPNPSPEQYASFPNQLSFWWFNGMGILGWKRPLVKDDLYDSLPDDAVSSLAETLQKNWDKEMDKLKASKDKDQKPYKPTLLKALFKTHWARLLMTFSIRLTTDTVAFITPHLLQLLIAFVRDGTEEAWKGYVYATGMVCAMVFQTTMINYYVYHSFRIGLHARAAVIACVYRKALKLTNSVKQASSVGELVNLVSIDAQRFMDFMGFFHLLWSGPYQIGLVIYFLYVLLGPAAFAGLGAVFLTVPLNAFAVSQNHKYQRAHMKDKDSRIKLMTEILNGIKVLKLYAWEAAFQNHIVQIRNRELKTLKKAAYFGAFSFVVFVLSPFIVSLVTFTTYVLSSEDNILDAERVFVGLALINIMRVPMTLMSQSVNSAIQARIAQNRISKFLQSDELCPDNAQLLSADDKNSVLITNGSFIWNKDDPLCLKDINIAVKEGQLAAIVGQVGTGKSSLCAAMLGLMEKLSGDVGIKGKVAYVPQQAWIQNLTVQNNILFGKDLDLDYYDRVVKACALVPDIETLPGGDQTEIGERGANLSGGQRQRISLARATYSDADVFIFDDPLSAVDAHVGKHIFEQVIGPNGILKDKTRILVTHGIGFLPQTDQIIVLANGTVSETGTYRQLVDNNGPFAEFLRTYTDTHEENVELDEFIPFPAKHDSNMTKSLQEHKPATVATVADPRKSLTSSTSSSSSSSSTSSLRRVRAVFRSASQTSKGSASSDKSLIERQESRGKLVEEEKSETGVVKWAVYLMFMKQMGYVTAASIAFVYCVYSGLGVGSNFWLSDWAIDADKHLSARTDYRLGVYGAFGVGQVLFVTAFSVLMAHGRIKASRNLHYGMLSRIMHCPMTFFDTTPLGRIINRFSKDVDTVDVLIPGNIEFWLYCLFGVISTATVICISTPPFAALLLPLGGFYIFMQRFYISTARQLKRLESVSRSPIYSHFQESLSGSGVIFATKQSQRFIKDNEHLVDVNSMALYLGSIVAPRWISVRLEFLGITMTFFVALFAVIGRDRNWGIEPESIGLSITYALSVNMLLNFLLWVTSDLENNIVCVERIKEYSEVPQEAAWTSLFPLEPGWPDKGHVLFKDYQARYRPGLDLVLTGLTAEFLSGEKIGIVGRTGAGKSSLTLALFRIIESAGGSITIDGVDIAQMGLHEVRSRITILPQEPVLFTGSLRLNLDPFQEHSDDEIWDALEHSHLQQFVSTLPEGLQHLVADGGENYSVGQRQLICLARALLRKTKILVLDEATAAIDLQTDDLIRQTIRDKFADCTIITIAHRINTIMDSTRIMVLDQGRVAEFAAPAELLQDKSGLFYSLAKTANLVS